VRRALLAVICAAVLVGCGSPASGPPATSPATSNPPEAYAIIGTVDLGVPSDHADVSRAARFLGAAVEVHDEAGRVIATGRTGGLDDNPYSLVVPFSVDGVPRAAFYQVSVLDVESEAYSFGDLQAANFKIELRSS
jgi:hypothetical protein